MFVKTVNRKVRSKKMKNNVKAKTEQITRPKTKPSPRRTKSRSSLRAENKNDEEPAKPVLRFSPTAWAKLAYFRDKSENEVGGFGITRPEDLLCITEFATVKQNVSTVSVSFDDHAVADFFDSQVDLARKPEQFARLWLHTHPAFSPQPSIIDEETFERVFGGCHWAVMFILAEDNRVYARLSFNVGPGGQMLIPVRVDFSRDFGPSDHELWDAEYSANVEVEKLSRFSDKGRQESGGANLSDYALPYDFMDEFEKMEPEERQFVLDELAGRPDLWDEEKEVVSL
jgi:proteasome lid subunit RPN8/RPN11